MKKKISKKFLILIVLLALSLATFFGCSKSVDEYFAIGTIINIKIDGGKAKSALKEIKQLIKEVEEEISTTLKESDVSKMNGATEGEVVEVGEHTAALFLAGQSCYELSLGAFNPYIFPLVKLWKFDPENFTTLKKQPPSEEEILRVKEYCVPDAFVFEKTDGGGRITKNIGNAMLDFGGLAKGYIADLAKKICQEKSVSEGIINIGGNIYLIGKEKTVAITSPRKDRGKEYYALTKLSNTSIVTSGDYERFYLDENNDKRYCHIIDTLTGKPINNGVMSVSVTGENSMLCDAMATAFCVVGEAGAEKLYENIKNANPDIAALMLLDKDRAATHKTVGNFQFTVY